MAKDSDNQLHVYSKKRLALMIIIGVLVVAAVATAIALTAYYVSYNNQQFTIHFYTNEADLEDLVVKRGDTVQFPVLQKPGYTFLGWGLAGDTRPVVPSYFEDTYDYSADVDLYALWDIIDPVVVTYIANGGSEVAPVNVPRGYALEAVGDSDREGYYFLGWCYDEQCLRVYNPDIDVIDKDITFYGKWLSSAVTDGDTATVRYETRGGVDADPAAIPLGNLLTFPENVYRMGYQLVGWYSDPDYLYHIQYDVLVTQDCTVYAKWEKTDAKMYVTFVMPEGAPEMPDIVLDYAAYVTQSFYTAPEWEGYRFVGMFLDAGFTQVEDFPFFITENKTYYLQYEEIDINRVEVTFVLYDDQVVLVPYVENAVVEYWDAQRAGYSFDGWYLDSAYTRPVPFGTTKAKDDLRLWAKWSKIQAYQDEYFYYSLSEDGTYLIAMSEVDRTVQDVVIPDTNNGLPVEEIASNLFAYRTIATISIGANVRVIGDHAFYGSSISSVTLPVGVREIGASAFEQSQLTTVAIQGQPSLGERAFYDCIYLKTVSCPLVFSVGDFAFAQCQGLNEVNIQSVMEMGNSVFSGCTALRRVNWQSAAIKAVPANTFSNCSMLTAIELPSSVTKIEYYAFMNSGLESFDTKNVQTIGRMAFNGCKSLATFTIRKALTSIEGSAPFSDCKVLQSFEIMGTNDAYSVKNGCLYNKDQTYLYVVVGNENYVMPSTVTDMDPAALLYSNVRNIFVQEGNAQYRAMDGALYTADGTTLLYYPKAKQDEVLTIPNGVTTLQQAAVVFNPSLQEVYLPASITTVQPSIFYSLPALTRIVCATEAVKTLVEQTENVMALCPNAVIQLAEE